MSHPTPGESTADRVASIRVSHQLAQLRERFGDRYDDLQWAAIGRQLAANAMKVAKLRSVTLTNADEPEIPFSPTLAAGQSR